MCNKYSLYNVYEDLVKNGSIVLRKGAFGRVSNSAKRRALKDSAKVADAIIADMTGMNITDFPLYLDDFLDCIVKLTKVPYGFAMKLALGYFDLACHRDAKIEQFVFDCLDNIFYEYCKIGCDKFLFSVYLICSYVGSYGDGVRFSCLNPDVPRVFNYLIGIGDAYYSDSVFLDYYTGNINPMKWGGSDGLRTVLKNNSDMIYQIFGR